MDVYRTEEEQIAAIKGWWQRNGVAVVVAALLAIGAYAGWKWYQHDRLERSLAAAALYQSMLQSMQEAASGMPGGDADAATRAVLAGDELIEKHAGTAYAGFAALLLAADGVERGDLAAAEKYLRQAADNGLDEGLRTIASDRLARVVSAQGRHDEALALLAAEVPAALQAGRAEVRGDILMAQGKRAEAKAAWQQAQGALKEGDPARALLELKLDYVAAD